MSSELTCPAEIGARQTSSVKAPRSSNLELFRIITMILIVAHHYVVNSGLTADAGPIFSDPLSWRSLFLLLFGAWGKTGINCFLLIGGYFMCTSSITPRKFAKLLGEVMFYRIIIGCIFFISGYTPITFQAVLNMLLPITSVGTGFTAAYLIFFLCIPFLNVLVRGMTEKQHIRLLLVCLFTYTVLGTLPLFSVTMNYVSWFIVLYLIASYVRLYPKKLFSNTALWGWMSLASLLISALSVVACTWLGTKLGRNIAYTLVTDSNTFLALLTGFCSFMFFRNMKLKTSKLINTVASSAFGVLLIHANSEAMRVWLWQDVLHNTSMYHSSWLIVHAVGSVLGIYLVCTLIDQLRIRLIEAPLFKLWDRHWDKVSVSYKKLESKICKKLSIQEDPS